MRLVPRRASILHTPAVDLGMTTSFTAGMLGASDDPLREHEPVCMFYHLNGDPRLVSGAILPLRQAGVEYRHRPRVAHVTVPNP